MKKLYVATQTVSKWKNGLSEPSYNNLCDISKLFYVSIDTLLGNKSLLEDAIIGIDGGGSKTEMILFSKNGYVYNHIIYKGTNPNIYGLSNVTETLINGISELTRKNDFNIIDVCAGLS